MLTKRELLLLAKLRENSRKPLSKISREINVPLSTVCDNLRRLEEKVISRHTSLMDFSKLGYPIKICFSVKTKDKKKLGEYLAGLHNVNSLYKAANDFLFVEAFFKNVKEVFEFREHIENNFEIQHIDEHHILEELKREEFAVSEDPADN